MTNCDRLRFQLTTLADDTLAEEDLSGIAQDGAGKDSVTTAKDIVPATREAAEKIAQDAESTDGFAPLSEQFVAGLSDTRVGHQHVLVFLDDELVGLAGPEGWAPARGRRTPPGRPQSGRRLPSTGSQNQRSLPGR